MNFRRPDLALASRCETREILMICRGHAETRDFSKAHNFDDWFWQCATDLLNVVMFEDPLQRIEIQLINLIRPKQR